MCILPTDLLVLCMYNEQCASPLVNYIQSLATYVATIGSRSYVTYMNVKVKHQALQMIQVLQFQECE